jgi:hypothetical protein
MQKKNEEDPIPKESLAPSKNKTMVNNLCQKLSVGVGDYCSNFTTYRDDESDDEINTKLFLFFLKLNRKTFPINYYVSTPFLLHLYAILKGARAGVA